MTTQQTLLLFIHKVKLFMDGHDQGSVDWDKEIAEAKLALDRVYPTNKSTKDLRPEWKKK